MQRIALILFVLLSLGRIGLAQTPPVTSVNINWPPDASGIYGFGKEGHTNQAKSYPVEEGQTYRVTGTGFMFSFRMDKGKVTFPFGLPKGVGVKFNGKDTFTFQAVPVSLDIQTCDVLVALNGVPKAESPPATPAASGKRDYKVVYGHHSLDFAGAKLPFDVDSTGHVSLQDSVKGITATGSTISVSGIPVDIVTTPDTKWRLTGTPKNGQGNATVYLLPTPVPYALQVGKDKALFYLDNNGMLSLDPAGPFVETIAPPAVASVKIEIPNGEALLQARIKLEGDDKQTFASAQSASAAAPWKQDFEMKEYMQVYDFPEELLSFPVTLPTGTNSNSLKLLSLNDGKARVVPFQLSTQDGKTTIWFRSDLPRGASRLFRLIAGDTVAGVKVAPVQPVTLRPGDNPHEAVLASDRLLVKVPAGHQDFGDGKPFSQVPAPILGLARAAQPQPWQATGSFVAPDTILVKSMDAKLLESGPLFARYQVAYTFKDDRKYEVTLEVRTDENYVAIGDALSGFAPEDNAFFKLSYGQGLNPDHRQVAGDGGYDIYSGDYGRNIDMDGKLNYILGLYTPNSIGVMHATTFYNDTGTDALLLAIDKLRDWKTSKRALWSSAALVDQLRFYDKDGDKYLLMGIAGAEHHWVAGLIPRSDVRFDVLPGWKAPGVGPEVRLLQKLTDFSLNFYKDHSADWDEKLVAAPFDDPDLNAEGATGAMTYDDYLTKYLQKSNFIPWAVNCSWDFSSENSPVSFRAMPSMFGDYARNRASWTPEQRKQVRQILLHLTYSSEGDANLPHHSMLAGHPNFVSDVKTTLPLACAAFPNHPDAKMWRDSFMGYYNEWLDKYDRKDVPELNTKGGRWTENIACYTGTCLIALRVAGKALKSYDGTSLGKNPELFTLIRWMRDSFMSPNDGVRMIPPQGAHSRAFEPEGRAWKSLFGLCADLAADNPELAQEMRWMETNGKEGKNPEIQSALYTDYGPVFHYDFGGPHESYAHMQDIYGSDYRWGHAGIVYYGARDKAWSYNTIEANGDQFNWKDVSAFTVNGKGLAPGPTNQLLYDFDFAQFYRTAGLPTDDYRARGLMLLRDDYLVLSDEVADPTTPGTFTWASVFEMPQIYQLKPAAPMTSYTDAEPAKTRPGLPPPRTGHIQSYAGTGDFLTVVAPAAVQAVAKPFGAVVNNEYVFASQSPVDVTEGPAVFKGTYGYARSGQLALFMGDKVGWNGFVLTRDGGDFGASAVAEPKRISGRIVGRSGGKLFIVPPQGLDAASAQVTVDGQTVPHTVEQGAIVFSVDLAQKDGLKNYAITF